MWLRLGPSLLHSHWANRYCRIRIKIGRTASGICGILGALTKRKLTKHGNSCKSSNYLKIIAIALCPFGGPVQIGQKRSENAKTNNKNGRKGRPELGEDNANTLSLKTKNSKK